MSGKHEHRHPVQPPLGTLWNPGPCSVCGKSWARVQAEKHLREAQEELAALDAEAEPPLALEYTEADRAYDRNALARDYGLQP